MHALASAARQLHRDLRTQKVRTALTLFGLVWGTAAVTLLLAFGRGLHKQIEANFKGLGENILICWPSRTSLPHEGLPRGRRIRLTEDDIELLRREVPGILRISGEYTGNLKVKAGRNTAVPNGSGVNTEFGAMRALNPDAGGRYLNERDMGGRRRVVFLGDKLARTLFGLEGAAGRELRIRGVPFTVIGVLVHKSQDSSYNSRDEDSLFMPATTYRALYGARYVDNFIVQVADPSRVAEVRKAMAAVLGGKHRYDPADEEAVQIWDTTEGFKFINAFFLIFRAFLGVVGTLTLVVGAIGVSNIMHVIVEERTREIGIKMALGAKPGFVIRQFLAEAALLTATGGLAGLALSWAICAIFPLLKLGEYVGTPEIAPSVGLLTAALLGLSAFVAGWFPARAAARLNPVEALRA